MWPKKCTLHYPQDHTPLSSKMTLKTKRRLLARLVCLKIYRNEIGGNRCFLTESACIIVVSHAGLEPATP